MLNHQTVELEVNMGLITMVYIQCTTLCIRSQVLPNVPLQVHKALRVLFITSFSSAFHINCSSRISPRHMTLVVNCYVCPERVGSFKPLKSLFLVNDTINICGSIDS